MIDSVKVCAYPHVVGATEATGYAVVTISGKDWWLCINPYGTPFFLPRDGSDHEH